MKRSWRVNARARKTEMSKRNGDRNKSERRKQERQEWEKEKEKRIKLTGGGRNGEGWTKQTRQESKDDRRVREERERVELRWRNREKSNRQSRSELPSEVNRLKETVRVLGKELNCIKRRPNHLVHNGSAKLAEEGSEVSPSNRMRQDIEDGEEHRTGLQVETGRTRFCRATTRTR